MSSNKPSDPKVSSSQSPKPTATLVTPKPSSKGSASGQKPSNATTTGSRAQSRSPPKSRVSTSSSQQNKRTPSPNKRQQSAKTNESSLDVEKAIEPLSDTNMNGEQQQLAEATIETVPEETVKLEPITGYVRSLVQLPDLTPELWTEAHDALIDDFLAKSDKRLLVFFIDAYEEETGGEVRNRLNIGHEIPTTANLADQFSYFIKSHYTDEINTKELFNKYVQYGTFGGKHLLSLLRLTSGLYAPLFFGNKTWPDSKESLES